MSRTKSAETLRPALEARLRVAGMMPVPIPKPEPPEATEPKKRLKAYAKAARNIDHANQSAMAKALDAAKAPWFGCNAGRAIASVPRLKSSLRNVPDVPTLWDAAQRVRAVYARHIASISAPSPHPRGMNLELLPEEFGSDGVEVDGCWDDRTEEEKVKDAAKAMMHLEQVLGMAGYGVLAEVKSVVIADNAVKHIDRLILGLAAVARDA